MQTILIAGVISKGPVMIGCQAAGAAPFLRGGPIERPENNRNRNPNWSTAVLGFSVGSPKRIRRLV